MNYTTVGYALRIAAIVLVLMVSAVAVKVTPGKTPETPALTRGFNSSVPPASMSLERDGAPRASIEVETSWGGADKDK